VPTDKPTATFRHLSAQAREAGVRAAFQRATEIGELHVFAYASLVWRPCFSSAACVPGNLEGHERDWCMWTVEARGSPEHPGLGLGLIASSNNCSGYLLTVAPPHWHAALEAMWEREMLTGVYQPVWCPVSIDVGIKEALVFVIDPTHPQYAGGLDMQAQAELIAKASGELGTNREYLELTVASMRDHGLRDEKLECLHALVNSLAACAPSTTE
jgi:glutathione-specific gamma-glutamylcyclotransferase